jgi:hypothetical protein
MRLFCSLTTALALAVLLIACSTVSPDQCWPNTTGGFGGSGTLPIGAGVGVTSGDFGSAPQNGPLDYSDPPNPCIEPETPCLGKCLASYEVTAAECGRIASDAERRTCQDSAYSTYKSCALTCHQSEVTDCLERCKQMCDKQNQQCIDNCPKGSKPCFQKCNEANGACLKDCDRSCK